MKKFYRVCIAIASTAIAIAPQCALAQGNVQQTVSPGIGFFGDPDGSWLRVAEFGNSTRVDIAVTPEEFQPIQFRTEWKSSNWTRISIDEQETGFSTVLYSFNPFEEDREAGDGMRGTVNLPPNDVRGYTLMLNTDSGSCSFQSIPPSDCGGNYQLDYELIEIEPPLPGDFNHDDEVGFADFLILSSFYEKVLSSKTSWRNGDANLDGAVDLMDFIILSDNFGADRREENTRIAATPEPSSNALVFIGFALIVIGLRRHPGRCQGRL